jgi:hypothetical protein
MAIEGGDAVGQEPVAMHRVVVSLSPLRKERRNPPRLPVPSPSPGKKPPPRQLLEQLPEARTMSPAQKGIIAKRGSAQPPEMEAQKTG